jgi:hypothetical protein
VVVVNEVVVGVAVVIEDVVVCLMGEAEEEKGGGCWLPLKPVERLA